MMSTNEKIFFRKIVFPYKPLLKSIIYFNNFKASEVLVTGSLQALFTQT